MKDDFFDIMLERYELLFGRKNRPWLNETELSFVTDMCDCYRSYRSVRKEDFGHVPLIIIFRYLECTHHYYRYNRLARIEQTIAQMKQDWQDDHPLLYLLPNFFARFSQSLLLHIQEEEEVLFPYLKMLNRVHENKSRLFDFMEYRNPVNLEHYLNHHDDDHELEFDKVLLALQFYEPSATNRSLYNVFQQQILHFRNDLAVHGSLEESVLLPRCVLIEKELNELMKRCPAEN
jgi:regulator of cell morphogenesis and NO signaling